MSSTITTCVPDDIDKKIKDISSIEHLDKSTVVRRLLSKAVQDWQIDHALSSIRTAR